MTTETSGRSFRRGSGSWFIPWKMLSILAVTAVTVFLFITLVLLSDKKYRFPSLTKVSVTITAQRHACTAHSAVSDYNISPKGP